MHSAYGTRLLSIGEILDRAVHLTIANLLPLAAIIGLVDVPVRAITDWFDRDEWTRYFGALGKIVEDPTLLPYFLPLSVIRTRLWSIGPFSYGSSRRSSRYR